MTVALSSEARHLAIGGDDSVCRVYELERNGSEISFGTATAATHFRGWGSIAIAGDQLFATHATYRNDGLLLDPYA
jgi:hypothetical protein